MLVDGMSSSDTMLKMETCQRLQGQGSHRQRAESKPENSEGCLRITTRQHAAMHLRLGLSALANTWNSPELASSALPLHTAPGKSAQVPSLLKMSHWHPITFRANPEPYLLFQSLGLPQPLVPAFRGCKILSQPRASAYAVPSL